MEQQVHTFLDAPLPNTQLQKNWEKRLKLTVQPPSSGSALTNQVTHHSLPQALGKGNVAPQI